MTDLTPLMKQYREIKERHKDAILFFRVGDFYEMFFEDAVVASGILEIALTSRDKSKEDSVPLCGIPYHAANGYIARLIRAGKSVAVCDQTEDPAQAKGLVRREVVRVVTPGTLVEPELLDAGENNFLAAVALFKSYYGLAWVDLSTGEFNVAQFEGPDAGDVIGGELARIGPRELLAAESSADRLAPSLAAVSPPPRLVRFSDPAFDPVTGRQTVLDHFRVQSLGGFGCEDIPLGIAAAGAILRYLQETQIKTPGHLNRLRRYRRSDHLVLDPIAQRTLELTRRMADGGPEGTLLRVLDRTVTPMGARLLRGWVLQPLLDLGEIRARQAGVEFLLNETLKRGRLRAVLKDIGDLERIIGRISLGSAHPRDLVHLKHSIAQLPLLHKGLMEPPAASDRWDREPATSAESSLIQSLLSAWDDLSDLHTRIHQTLVDSPPPGLTEGGLIREGVDARLDELRTAARDAKQWIAALEAKERKRTGIESLKVRYNQVFGYYIEVTKTHLSRIPPDFHRKQTLVNAERFVTPELKELETQVLGAEDQSRRLEMDLFIRLRTELAEATLRVQAMARATALLDVFTTLAEVAAALHYVKPDLHDGDELRIVDGRHPVLESALPRGARFVPNDTLLDAGENRLLVVTGPNMAGKSTYMRQVALIVILAQMGSFVPAAEARIGRVDRIFTRVGASDDLTGGQSTFMMEMTETAAILNQATPHSLVLMDEIGRGTSTFDGLSIAWAVAEYLQNPARVGARTLFATHYHQLTELALTYPGVKNYNIAVREWNDEIIFLHKIVEGGTDRSYGIQVARLAGLPEETLRRARQILADLESGEIRGSGRPRAGDAPASRSRLAEGSQFSLFVEEPHPVIRELQNLDITRLTPMDAINLLDELKKKTES